MTSGLAGGWFAANLTAQLPMTSSETALPDRTGPVWPVAVWGVDTTSGVYGLQVILLKRVYVLPWSQFLYAEGTGEEVQAFFSTHDVLVQGSGLDSLLAWAGARYRQRILSLRCRTLGRGTAESATGAAPGRLDNDG
jgi:hypothetical protein